MMPKRATNLEEIGLYSRLRGRSIVLGSRFLMLSKGIRISMRSTRRPERIERRGNKWLIRRGRCSLRCRRSKMTIIIRIDTL